jgi:SNF2 family DNA or RNA helicase
MRMERQNSVEELYSLIKFLQIKPLNDWQTFNEQIAKPVKGGTSVRAMKRLHVSILFSQSAVCADAMQVVLKAIMLRRRKDHVINGKPILNLPARKIKIVPCDFSTSERAFYDAVNAKVAASLDKIMGSDNRSYTSILLLLLRLRQGGIFSVDNAGINLLINAACNHPMLISKDYQDDSEALESTPVKNGEDEDDEDGLAAMFGRLNVKTRVCQVCQAKCVNPS